MNLLKYPVLKLLLVALLLGFTQLAKAQSAQTGINDVLNKIEGYNSQIPAEKLYMQFDKPYYAIGDTIWFKAYLLNSSLKYSPLSSRLYVEVLNDSSKVIRRMACPMAYGNTWGNISLEGFREGSYSIRAYTNWMRNFGQDYFYNKAFYVANAQRPTWLVDASSSLTGDAANNVKMAVKFTSLDNQPAGLKQMQLRVLEGKKVLFKGTAQTNAEGQMDVNFPLPEKTAVKDLVLVAQDKADNKRLAAVPVSANRGKDVDLQFMPEGGYLVAGLPSHIGFKAVGDDGHGVNLTGKIINTVNNTEVITFQSLYKGIGIFDLAPQPGDVYVARITLPGGQTKDVPLPAVKTSGTELRVRNIAERDSMDVFVFLSPDLVKPGGAYYLVGQSRGTVCFGAGISTGKPFATVHVAKSLFPTGVAHFTLLNTANQPLNERLTFINHHDDLKINIQADKGFAPHDSIPVKISVNDAAGKPVVGSFSVAVTDDAQIKADSTDNIMSRFLLSSDLKGYIEDPTYYFTGDKTSWQALDGLLLTQGWIGYDWTAINAMKKPVFQPEYQYTVNGRVGNLINKPVAKAEVTLLARGRYNYIKDTTTSADGRFVFNKFPSIDSATFILQARNARHKIINAGITIDENVAPDVVKGNIPRAKPWYVNSSATMLNYVKTNPTYHNEQDKAHYGPQGRLLNTVTIRNNAIVKGSENLNGAGEADQVIDEQTIEDANKISLSELLEQKVKGFRIGYLPKGHDMYYFLKDKRVHFVIDGIDLNRFYQPVDADGVQLSNDYYNYIKSYLDYFTAEDIKGIEVLYSTKYTNRYNVQNLSTDELLAENPAGRSGSATASIEITTRAGNGPFTQRANGIYVYKPLKSTLPKDFYRPRYPVKDKPVKYADLRSTIHWQPSVITGKDGQATVSFYAADKPTTYTITFEGSDLNGNVGHQTQKITIGSSGK
jgi:hypothetical protein